MGMSRAAHIVSLNVMLIMLAALLSGCASEKLIPTPYVMVGDQGRAYFDRVDPAFRNPDMPVLYVTDRAVDREVQYKSGTGPRYGYGRSQDVSYGVATVSVDPEVTWEQFAADSSVERRSRSYTPEVTSVEPMGTFRSTTKYLEPRDGTIKLRRDAMKDLAAEQADFYKVMDRWLDHTDRKEVLVFVHGYNNEFDDAAIRMAQTWHFGGRLGVPIVFTWPAGSGGLKGYAYDRESGEFAVVHLKMLLWALANNPKVDRVHLISHSRGTDVASTALRELHGEIRGYQMGMIDVPWMGMRNAQAAVEGSFDDVPPTWQFLKLETLVLAAPDLDLDVFIQRFFGENVIRAAHRTVIYFSESDKAIGLADWLFRSRRRVGAMRMSDFKPEIRPLFARITSLDLINARVTGYTSHSYILQHPAALSDLVLVLRDREPPGPDGSRPLKREDDFAWELDNDYLKPKPRGN